MNDSPLTAEMPLPMVYLLKKAVGLGSADGFGGFLQLSAKAKA